MATPQLKAKTFIYQMYFSDFLLDVLLFQIIGFCNRGATKLSGNGIAYHTQVVKAQEATRSQHTLRFQKKSLSLRGIVYQI